jgi:carbon storage regulator
MLIISRKSGESFLIDDSIEVTVLDVSNDKIKIGISAPQHIKIIRKELKETESANLEAAQASRADGMLGEKMGKKRSL